ncbi:MULTISPECIES: hypothetical protein [Methylobacterium]|uniref:hypothetical protein n=1 Tax=Methylobacterium TaxID=407 RepID=UPI0011C8471E|nr:MULTISPECIES: hypothetical protein [Methylobacterium]TXN77598.1 hypothetical protein FV234_23595 [Methylobacterium sp. WL8]
MKSTASFRGHTVGLDDRIRYFESEGESNICDILSVRQDVIEIVEQPSAIRYIDQEGKESKHTFDFRVRYLGDHVDLLAYRPIEKLVDGRFESRMRLLAPQLPRSAADEVAIVTEADADKTDVFNARLKQACRRDPPSDVDGIVAEIVDGLLGVVPIAWIVGRAGTGSAFRSVVRCVAADILVPTIPARITPALKVYRKSGK